MSLLNDLKTRVKRRLGVPSVERALEALAARGFRPGVVFDVGAYHGEFARFCRRTFTPAPRVYCFEPLSAALAVLAGLEREEEVTVVPGLVGSRDEDAIEFREMETASSVLVEHHDPAARVARHPMRRLDSVIGTPACPAPPDLLKIDTQGYELEVLRGIEGNLPRVRAVLAEVNFLDIHRDVALAPEVIGWMAQRGMVPYDICSLIRRPLDGALWQADMIFLRADDPLRADKRWG